MGSSSGGSSNEDFIGCMPVSFQRHHFEEVQNGDYYVSEKTDGVRYLMVFTGSNVVLLDRNMQGWKPKPLNCGGAGGAQNILENLAKHIAPGTVFDGEVVINRKSKRPIFIVFDLLCNGGAALVKHAFKERLKQLREGNFVINLGDVKIDQVIDGKVRV